MSTINKITGKPFTYPEYLMNRFHFTEGQVERIISERITARLLGQDGRFPHQYEENYAAYLRTVKKRGFGE